MCRPLADAVTSNTDFPQSSRTRNDVPACRLVGNQVNDGVALSGSQQFAGTAAISCEFDHRNRTLGYPSMIPQWGLGRKGSARSLYTRSTNLSTTFFSPAFSKAMVSLLPSIRITAP